jgi:simple sugar transport system substrate-binding protein/basic membrane protein A
MNAKKIIGALSGFVAGCLMLSACTAPAPEGQSSGGKKDMTVGVIMIGSSHDAGYNEAVADAANNLKKVNGVRVITAEQIPETNAVTDTMQQMADQGAKVIFATSYGYFKYALEFAKKHPNIVVLHQGGYQDGAFPSNFGTYWGAAYEPVSLGGMAAGKATKTNKLGFVYAFPISQSIANIDAFQLGAASVNPQVKTYLVNTSNWCDPVKQKEAVNALSSQGVDVFSQHQDCQTTVIQTAKDKGAKVVGYHYDAAKLAGDSWLTGSAWNWTPVMKDIVKTVSEGKFKGSQYNANWIGTFANGDNPLELASFGPSVDKATQDEILAKKKDLSKKGSGIFTGPIYCQDGTELVKNGVVASYQDINNFSCLVKGVVGTLPAAK